METPQKLKRSRRMVTTAATDKNDTIIITVEDEKRSRIKTQIHSGLTQVRTRLHFETDKQKLFAEKTRNQAKIEAEYRKNMISYLNKKFAEAISNSTTHREVQRKIEHYDKGKYDKIVEKVAYLFQQFMDNVREIKAIQRFTEYELGNILKNMSFIKSLLNQRATVAKLYQDFIYKNIQNLLMFLLHFYIIINNEANNRQTLKNTLLENIRNLFALQGINTQLNEFEKIYENGLKISKNSQYRYMRSNRQNRHTVSSLYHSLNRRKK